MRMLGWSSMEMVRNYEREMEELKAESDMRSINAVCNMPELKFSAAEISSTPQEKFQLTKDILEQLIARYSNLTIGKIYKISNVAVKHWLDKFGLKREKRIESADISDEEIQRIRISLQKAA